ncbi:MAG: polar amino acid transport system substrate-binding protein [Oceanospirillaceae bacterium]|jgi:polar amino acid transport system substrate-binding protein
MGSITGCSIYIKWIILLCILPTFSSAQNIINFNVTPKTYPPFFTSSAAGESGIFLEIMQEIVSRQGDILHKVKIPRKRGDTWVKNGKLNVAVRALEWVPRANDYSFSDPVLQYKSVLVSRGDKPLEFQYVKQLKGKKLITYLGFKYPVLDSFFMEKSIARIDVSSGSKMLQLIEKGRADAAIMNETVARWLIKEHKYKGVFYLSKGSLGVFDIRLMFNKAQKKYVESVNRTLANIKQEGKLQQIFNKYQ